MRSTDIPRVVGYARVSTREQAENFAALDQQIARLEAAGVERVLVDVESGREGKEADRPQFQQIMQWVKDGVVEKVVITRLDRLSRSLPTLRKALDEFQKAECVVLALDDNLDISTAAGKFHVNMLGAMAEMESDRLSERINRGKEYFRKMKRASHAPFGYVVRDYAHVVDRTPFLCLLEERQEYSRADLGREMIERYMEERSLNGTCRYMVERYGFLVLWQSALRRWITSPVLVGDLVYYPKSKNPIIHPDTHEPLMSRDEAKTIRDYLAFNQRGGGFGWKRSIHPLSGLVKCECGGGCISANGSVGRIKYFVCHAYRARTCHRNKGVRMDKLEAAVVKALTERAEAIAAFADIQNPEESPELKDLRAQLSDLEAIAAMPNRTVNPAISEAARNLKADILRLEQVSASKAHVDEGDRELLKLVAASPGFWESLEDPQKQRFFRALVDHVLISNGKILGISLKV
jgi:site-specific DNA recombinase